MIASRDVDGVSLQGLSVLTRVFVDAGIFSRRAKSIRGAPALRRPAFRQKLP